MIQEADVVPLRESKRPVHRRANASLGGELDPHTRTHAAEVFEDFLGLSVLGGIVNDAPLPIGE